MANSLNIGMWRTSKEITASGEKLSVQRAISYETVAVATAAERQSVSNMIIVKRKIII
jgi:hypothetical protein